MRIFHIATVADWQRARESGAYTTSTVGRTLEDEGFLHAAHSAQVAGVFDRYYRGGGQPLVLLTIDTDRLGVPWSEDPVGDETFPHIYGPLSPQAVVGVQPLDRNGRTDSYGGLFAKEMGIRLLLAFVTIALAYLGSRIGAQVDAETAGTVAGFVLGAVLVTVVLRRRGRWSALRSRTAR